MRLGFWLHDFGGSPLVLGQNGQMYPTLSVCFWAIWGPRSGIFAGGDGVWDGNPTPGMLFIPQDYIQTVNDESTRATKQQENADVDAADATLIAIGAEASYTEKQVANTLSRALTNTVNGMKMVFQHNLSGISAEEEVFPFLSCLATTPMALSSKSLIHHFDDAMWLKFSSL